MRGKKGGMMGILGALWGLSGVTLLLSSAIYRLAPIGLDAFNHPFAWYHWASLALFLVFMIYAEGYRGFQQRFSPRVASRAKYLRDNPRLLHALLGPFFCMGFFHATRRRKITSISVTLGIVALVILVRLLSQPWRGIIDIGVVVGLAWGLISLLAFIFQAFFSEKFSYSPEVPGGE